MKVKMQESNPVQLISSPTFCLHYMEPLDSELIEIQIDAEVSWYFCGDENQHYGTLSKLVEFFWLCHLRI